MTDQPPAAIRLLYALCVLEALAFLAIVYVLLAHESDPATAGLDEFAAMVVLALGVAFILPAYLRARRGKSLTPAFLLLATPIAVIAAFVAMLA